MGCQRSVRESSQAEWDDLLTYLCFPVCATAHTLRVDHVRSGENYLQKLFKVVRAKSYLFRQDMAFRQGFYHANNEDVANDLQQRGFTDFNIAIVDHSTADPEVE